MIRQGSSLAARSAAALLVVTGMAAMAPATPSSAAPASISSQPGGKIDRCDPAGPISLSFFDARRSALKTGTVEVTYEQTAAGLPQRTIFLERGGYVISVCNGSGAIREERYERISAGGDPAAVSIADVAPDGKAVSVDIYHAEAAAASASNEPPASDRPKVLTPPQVDEGDVRVTPEARALTTWNLKPGKRSIGNSRAGSRAERTPEGPVAAPAYYISNKCVHNSGVDLGRKRSPRNFTYVSALGSFYDGMVIGGARAFPDVWNYCGWTVGSGLDAAWGGNIGSFTIANNGVNEIGWSTVCGLACNYTWSDWDPALGAYRILDNDIAITPTPTHPYANGAVAGHIDFQSLVAHEFGHSWGFGDFYNDPYGENHIMYGIASLGVDDRRYLAYGDYQIMRSMYP